jgi:hypothetical protein
VEAKGWQAFYAALLVERSKFGLNELLDVSPNEAKTSTSLTRIGRTISRLGAEDAANKPGVASAGYGTKREEQGVPDKLRAPDLMTNKPASMADRDNSERRR